MTDKVMVVSTCGTQEEARKVAHDLVEARLAACVNIVPGVESVYHWRDAVEVSGEWMLLIKTRRSLFDSLCERLRRTHPYQVPEAIAVPIVDGLEDYLKWIETETKED